MIYQYEEWLDKAKELFGTNAANWKWQCPACKRIQTPNDFRAHKEKGAEPTDAYQKCVGRFTGGRKGPDKCDWAAFGLFRGPDCVIKDGKEVWVFEFSKGTVDAI